MANVVPLTSKQIKTLRLLRKRTGRHARGLFFIEGERAVQQIITNDVLEVSSVILDKRRIEVNGTFNDMLKNTPLPKFTVSSSVFRQLTDTETAQGVMAVCYIPQPASADKLLEARGMMLVADRIQDPGNMGTMIRTAVWFGLKGVVVSPGTVDLFHPKVVRSTAGSTGVLPWMETELPDFLTKAKNTDWRIHLLDATPEAVSLRDLPASGKDVLVVGNEANGIADELKQKEFFTVQIDRGVSSTGIQAESSLKGVESLNVSVAAAIAMAHFSMP